MYHQRFLLLMVVAWLCFVGLMIALYLWIASRQVRPRPAPTVPPTMPTSPTSKRKRHSRSFGDKQELERELMEETALIQNDWRALPMSLKRKCSPEQCKLIYDTLSKIFSFLRTEYIDTLAEDIQICRYNHGDSLFEKGQHDGSILMVASGEVMLIIHGESDEQFTKRISCGETVMSSLALLAFLVDEASRTNDMMHKVMGTLSAQATTNDTIVFQISSASVSAMMNRYPDCFLRLAQAALSQTEKITAKNIVDHFGLAREILTPLPVIPNDIIQNAMHEYSTDHSKETLVTALIRSLHIERHEIERYVKDMDVISSQQDSIVLEHGDTMIYIVFKGTIRVQTLETNEILHELKCGEEIGMVSGLVGQSTLNLRLVVSPDSTILLLSQSQWMTLLQQDKQCAIRCVQHVIQQYSSLVCVADCAFDSLHLHGGESLFDRGDICDSVFTIMSGRLRAIQVHQQHGKNIETATELVRGATLGALDMLAAGRSNSSVFAIRDSQISQMPRCVFEYIVKLHPTVLIHFTTNLAQKLDPEYGVNRSSRERRVARQSRPNYLLSLGSVQGKSSIVSSLPLSTIAIVSLTKQTEISIFCLHLEKALHTIGSTEIVSSQKASHILGEQWQDPSRVARANLSSWLGEMETAHDLLIYEADPQLTPWTKLCIRQADHIMLLCSDADPPQAFLKEIVRMLETAWTRKNVAINVVRIRDKDWTLRETKTSRTNRLKRKLQLWKRSPMLPKFLLPMEKYEWISCFHNVQTPFVDHHADFLRISRRITGRAVGLVLGGGGARGLAHIGVLRALEECGIHVDVVGGTSIGAFIGALYALHPHQLSLVCDKIGIFSIACSSILEKLRDLTLPIASFFNGTRFNQSIQTHFFDLAIEDLMLNYFCVSTDIAKSRMSVHRSGPVWKYVRASMSLQGYLPPISENGSLLVDGGYMNNLPADVMKEEGGIKYVLAVDVGSEPRREYYAYGTSLSGWWLLWNRINPFAKTAIVPSMGDVSAALAYVASEQHKERMKAECIDLFIRPPVNEYGTLQFDKMEEIIKVGYDHALPRVKAWASRVLSTEPNADIVGKRDDEKQIDRV